MTASTTQRTTAKSAKSRIAAVGAIAVSRHSAADRLRRPDEVRRQHQVRLLVRAARGQAPEGDPRQGRHPGRLGHRVRARRVQGQVRQGDRYRPRPREGHGQAARREVRVPERHVRHPGHGPEVEPLRHRHVGHDRHQGPSERRRLRHRQEGRRRRRLRRLLQRGRLDLHPEGQDPGHQDLGRPLRQEDRRAARHRLPRPRQVAGQEVPVRQEARHPVLRRRPAGADPSALRRRGQPAPPTSRSPRTRSRPRAAARTSSSSATRSRPPRTASRSPRTRSSCATPSRPRWTRSSRAASTTRSSPSGASRRVP